MRTQEKSFQAEYEPRKLKLKGTWFVRNYGPDGELKDERQGHNVITENALDFLASFLNSAAAAAATFTMRYVAIGTDATSEAASNTALGTESARTTGTVSYVSSAIYRVTATFPSGLGTGAIVEYGLFSSSTAGTMLNRDTESVVNKGANDTLVVQTDITIA
jgi:hypothetical protein